MADLAQWLSEGGTIAVCQEIFDPQTVEDMLKFVEAVQEDPEHKFDYYAYTVPGPGRYITIFLRLSPLDAPVDVTIENLARFWEAMGRTELADSIRKAGHIDDDSDS